MAVPLRGGGAKGWSLKKTFGNFFEFFFEKIPTAIKLGGGGGGFK